MSQPTPEQFVAAIDQGTTSSRCMIFDHSGVETPDSCAADVERFLSTIA